VEKHIQKREDIEEYWMTLECAIKRKYWDEVFVLLD